MTPHVLIVDDDPHYSELLALLFDDDRRLTVAGCARNGREAVELVLSCAPDVVLMDVNMPVADGLQAARELHVLRPELPVVLISAATGPDDRRRASRTGAHAFLSKELGPEALIEAVLAAASQEAHR